MAEQWNAGLVALLNEWLAEDNGPDDADLEQQMRDLDAARHATQSLFWPTEPEVAASVEGEGVSPDPRVTARLTAEMVNKAAHRVARACSNLDQAQANNRDVEVIAQMERELQSALAEYHIATGYRA